MAVISISLSSNADQPLIIRHIESGNTDELSKILISSSGIEKKFLEAVLSSSGDFAVPIYEEISENYPNTPFGWESLRRLYEYYYATGLYGKASEIGEKLNRRPQNDFKPIAAIESKPEDTPYWVQVGAFSDRKNAERLGGELSKNGFKYKIMEKRTQGKLLNIVRAGGYSDINEAKAALEIISEKMKITGKMVKVSE